MTENSVVVVAAALAEEGDTATDAEPIPPKLGLMSSPKRFFKAEVGVLVGNAVDAIVCDFVAAVLVVVVVVVFVVFAPLSGLLEYSEMSGKEPSKNDSPPSVLSFKGNLSEGRGGLWGASPGKQFFVAFGLAPSLPEPPTVDQLKLSVRALPCRPPPPPVLLLFGVFRGVTPTNAPC